LQQPFEVQASAQAGGPTDINLNFKEILEKQSPEAAAAFKGARKISKRPSA